MEFGSWARNGEYIRPTLLGDGFSVGGSETAGQSFAEFNLYNVEAAVFVYPPFPNDPLGDWPVILYDVECSRSSKPYVRGYLLLQVMLNFCAFACMWIPPQVGERMGLAITSLLAAVASELVVSEQLPNAEESNWFVIFAICSMLLTPKYLKWIQEKWRSRNECEMNFTSESGAHPNHDPNTHDASDLTDQMGGNLTKSNGADGIQNNASFDLTSEEERRKLRPESSPRHDGMNASIGSNLGRRDAEDFRDEKARQNNLRWQKVSRSIDDYSRLIIPSLYIIFLAVIFAQAGNSSDT
ncbi:MAG: hypothetical protein SGARI_003742 [Bacillariaceae sp.]